MAAQHCGHAPCLRLPVPATAGWGTQLAPLALGQRSRPQPTARSPSAVTCMRAVVAGERLPLCAHTHGFHQETGIRNVNSRWTNMLRSHEAGASVKLMKGNGFSLFPFHLAKAMAHCGDGNSREGEGKGVASMCEDTFSVSLTFQKTISLTQCHSLERSQCHKICSGLQKKYSTCPLPPTLVVFPSPALFLISPHSLPSPVVKFGDPQDGAVSGWGAEWARLKGNTKVLGRGGGPPVPSVPARAALGAVLRLLSHLRSFRSNSSGPQQWHLMGSPTYPKHLSAAQTGSGAGKGSGAFKLSPAPVSPQKPSVQAEEPTRWHHRRRRGPEPVAEAALQRPAPAAARPRRERGPGQRQALGCCFPPHPKSPEGSHRHLSTGVPLP